MSDEAKVFIGKNECESCAEEGKQPEPKWGIVIRLNDKSIFICEDCIAGIQDQIKVIKQKEKEGLIRVGEPTKA